MRQRLRDSEVQTDRDTKAEGLEERSKESEEVLVQVGLEFEDVLREEGKSKLKVIDSELRVVF